MRLWSGAGTVIFAVLIGLAGLLHSHTAAALTLASIGVVAGFAVAYDIGREHGRRTDRPSVVLAGAEGAWFDGRGSDYMVLWLQLRARNHHQATVLTDWSAVLTLGASTFMGKHSTNETFPLKMKNLVALDQETASTPLHGEKTGWVSFGVGISMKWTPSLGRPVGFLKR